MKDILRKISASGNNFTFALNANVQKSYIKMYVIT